MGLDGIGWDGMGWDKEDQYSFRVDGAIPMVVSVRYLMYGLDGS